MGAPQGLDYQLASVIFDKGLDTHNQKKLVVPGKWNVLNNLTLQENGTPIRRDGVTNLVAGRTGNGLATYNNQLLAIDGEDVYSVSKALSTANQVSGAHGFVGIAKKEIQRSIGMQDSVDVAVGSSTSSATNNLTCYVWREKTATATVTGVNVALFDESTGTVLIQNTQMRTNAAVFCPRVVFCPNVMANGGTFYIFYNQGGNLYGRSITTAAPTTLTAEALLVFGGVAGINFDCCAFGTATAPVGATGAMVSFVTTVAPNSVLTMMVDGGATPTVSAGPTAIFTAANITAANICAITCVPFSAALAATFIYGFAGDPLSGVAGATINAAFAVVTAETLINIVTPTVNNPCHITASVVGSIFRVAWDERSSWSTANSLPLYSIRVSSVMAQSGASLAPILSSSFAGAATDPAGPRGPYISGKAFTSGGRVLLPIEVLENYQALAATKANNNQQSTCFILDIGGTAELDTKGIVGKALYGAVGVATINNNPPVVAQPCSTPALGDGSFAYGTTERTLLSFVGGFNISPTGVVRLTLTPNTTQAPIKAQLGESTYLSGGMVTNFDGVRVQEHPFHLFPEGINVEVVNAAGTMTDGVHLVVCIYEWVDHAGQRHQSAPSLPVSATCAGGNDALRVRVPTLHCTQLTTLGEVKVVAYITQAGGLTFNRVGTVGAGAAGTDNDPTAAYVTLPDITQPDAEYAVNEVLYNQPLLAGTTLPNLGPPPTDAVWTHGGRLFFNQADQPGLLGYSQPYTNNLGLQFNPALALTWPIGEGGTFKAGAELDEKNIVFCSRKLYVSYGTGPNLAGNFSNYSDLQAINSDVGCSDARSVLSMPQGIIFKSAKGFYLLGRDLSVRYIGEGVAEFDSYTITGAVLLEDRHECRFGTNSTAHPQLIYSYLGEGQWSTNSYVDATYVTRDALWWPTQGQYVAIDATYGVQTDWSNKYDSFSGTGRGIAWTARTSFLHLVALGGFQRARWLFLTGVSQAANPMGGNSPQSDFKFDVYLSDVYTAAAYSFTVDLNTISFASPLDTVDLRHKIESQKCKSIAFQFTDTPTLSEGQSGYQMDGIQALTLEVGLRRGTMKLAAAQGVS